ncbi:hypothetical protein Tco_0669539, partial [Tanacetum coccineum]
VEDKAGGDEDDEMDYTTSLLYDDVDVRRNDLIHIDEGLWLRANSPLIYVCK